MPPIFVWEPGDLSIFGSVASACNHLEATDVRQNLYSAYDHSGRKLTLEVAKGSRRYWLFTIPVELVVMRRASAMENAEELRELLITFLTRVGEDPARLRSRTLSELADSAYRRVPIRNDS